MFYFFVFFFVVVFNTVCILYARKLNWLKKGVKNNLASKKSKKK